MLYNILLIDDNTQMLDIARMEWKKYGGCLTNVLTAQEGLWELKSKEYQLVIIMVDFAKDSLLPTIKKIRDTADLPIIVMTSDYDRIEKISTLRCGADEYFSVPETMEEIVLSGYAHIRRYCAFDCCRHQKKEVTYNGIHLDLRERKVIVDDMEIYLTRGEFNCLSTLMSQPGKLFSYELLYYGCFGDEVRAEDIVSSVRSIIKRIRHKIGSDHAKHIRAVHGVGYKIE